MDEQLNKTIRSCIYALLRPAIKFSLRSSIGIRDLTDIAKSCYIDVASDELKKKGINPTDSRICAMSGIQRTAIKDYREHGLQKGTTQYLYRVIGQWRRDKQYLNNSGRPRVLSVKGNDSEFHDLVRLISTHLHPKAVLFALDQIGAVEVNENEGTVKLLYTLLSKAKMDPLRNAVLINQAIGFYGEELITLLKKNKIDIQQFLKDRKINQHFLSTQEV